MMKTLNTFPRRPVRALQTVALAAALVAAGPSLAVSHIEVGDAGQTQNTAQATGSTGLGLDSILGSLASATDADLYVIDIVDPLVFSASTVNAASEGLDTQLFLFALDGTPIYTNDDAPGGLSLLSALPAGSALGPTSAGRYLLGVSVSGYDPVNVNAQALFTPIGQNALSTDVRGPATALQPAWLGGFADGGLPGSGSYDIQLTGAVTAVPEPASGLLAAAGLIGLLAAVRRQGRRRMLRALPLGGLLLGIGAAQAGPVPANLGAGLGELVAARYAAQNPNSSLARQRQAAAAPDMMSVRNERVLMRDRSDRVLVTIVVDGRHAYEQVRAAIAALPGVNITAEDRRYRAGILEGYVAESSLVALATTRGVSAVHAVNRPTTNVGSITQQGLVQHRVDQIPQYDGTGISIGVLSDSYNTAQNFVATGAPLTIREANDIASGDLPGPGNPLGNTQPVIVFEDFGSFPNANATDEGRGMMQLVHDMAPKAKLAFASAFNGEVSFANNIRALAGIQGLPNSRPDFAAQVIVDDVQYFNEGMFADTVVAQAVDDVAALGVAYFASAGNTPPTQGYASDFRLVPAGAGATAGTNLRLNGVDPALYAGGFHNFRSDGGQDIAQTVTLAAGAQLRFVLQWDDPYDVTPTSVGTQILQVPGTVTASAPQFDATFANPTAGQRYQVDVQGVSDSGNPGGAFDAVVTVIQPDGSTLLTADTGPGETFTFFATQTGSHTVRVAGFEGDTGSITVTVNEASGTLSVTSDFNVLLFHPRTGRFLGSVAENNLVTNRPVELPGTLTFASNLTQVQMVIARGNTPTAPVPASRLRYKMLGAAFPSEYVSYSTPITYGHNSAAGANGVAAYSPFQPNIPEDFSSTGPVRIVWDRDNNRIPDNRQVRLKPDMAAMDGGNTTFFISDTSRDLDTLPNFFGTSAAAPNAAAIAVLVLQAKGGPGSVTPAQMKTLLQRSAFQHDLDPYSSRGQALALPNRGKVTVTMVGDNSITSQGDANGTTIAYVGPSSISSITFDASTGNPGGGSVVNPSTPGLVFDSRPNDGSLITGGQPFVVGAGSIGLTSANVTATYSNPAPAPSVVGQNYRVTLNFTPGSFTAGKVLRFGLDRDEQRSAFVPPAGDSRNGSSADLAGAGVRIPAGTVAAGGITFSGTLADGSTFSGVMANRIGNGYSFLDGFGFVNAQSAVSQPLP